MLHAQLWVEDFELGGGGRGILFLVLLKIQELFSRLIDSMCRVKLVHGIVLLLLVLTIRPNFYAV